MNWAWEQVLPPVPKLLLMALADAADDEGGCWPAIRTLATKSCLSTRTVQRILKGFEESGVLVVSPRFTPTGRQTSSFYRLEIARRGESAAGKDPRCQEGDNLSPSALNNAHRGVSADTPGTSKLCHPRSDRTMSPPEPPYESKSESLLQHLGDENGQSALCLPTELSAIDRRAISALVLDICPDSAQLLLDELTAAVQSKSTIKTTPVQWFRGLVRKYQAGDFSPTEMGASVRRSRESRKYSRTNDASRPPQDSAKIRQQAALLLAQLKGGPTRYQEDQTI